VLDYKRIGTRFAPALGFVNRVGVTDYLAEVGYSWRHGKESSFRLVRMLAESERFERLADGALESSLSSLSLALETHAADTLKLELFVSREALREPFPIYTASDGSRSVVLPAGDYSFLDAAATLSSSDSRRLSGSLMLRSGDYYDGRHHAGELALSWKPSRHLALKAGYSQEHIDLPAGRFIVRLMSAGATVALDARWAWSTLLQFDNLSRVLGLNSRLRWQPRAGRETLLVVNYGEEDRDRTGGFALQSWNATLKYSHTLRF
jgi:hypothetical protein